MGGEAWNKRDLGNIGLRVNITVSIYDDVCMVHDQHSHQIIDYQNYVFEARPNRKSLGNGDLDTVPRCFGGHSVTVCTHTECAQ